MCTLYKYISIKVFKKLKTKRKQKPVSIRHGVLCLAHGKAVKKVKQYCHPHRAKDRARQMAHWHLK